MQMYNLINKLHREHNLQDDELLSIIKCNDADVLEYLYKKADETKRQIYGTNVYIRGLIEITNICQNNCYYCGIRAENRNCKRYKLTENDIINIVKTNYPKGYRTFVLQGGECSYYTDEILCKIIREIKELYPDCCITLSLGERTKESYQKLFTAGAERYLLRHETANEEHYKKLHPEKMSYNNRIECLHNLKEIGFQTGCGFMIGSPFQTQENIVQDLRFIKQFNPEMCGVGPFISHTDTPFKTYRNGTLTETLKIIAIIRLLIPDILLPATTALATISPNGRILGLKAGANVIMPNLLPENTAKNYMLYDNKIYEKNDIKNLTQEIKKAGYDIIITRGDNIRTEKKNV